MPDMIFDTKQNLTRRVDTQELYGLPVDTSIAFSNRKGIYKHSIERQQRKLLKKLGFLAPFLGQTERILFVTTGCSPASFVEQLLTGAFLHPLKRALFVITDRRILHIPTTQWLRYRYSIAQIPYVDCRQLRIRGSTLIAGYRSGRAERFHCIRFRGRRKVRALLKTMSFEDRPTPALERVHLCPSCAKPLIRNYYACPNCSLKFKSKAWATFLSIIFPGGGYFYTRHPVLGILEATMEIAFFFLLAVALDALSISYPKVPDGLYQAVAVCIIILVFEKLTTALFSGKCISEFIPKKRRVALHLDKILTEHGVPKSEEMLATGWRSV